MQNKLNNKLLDWKTLQTAKENQISILAMPMQELKANTILQQMPQGKKCHRSGATKKNKSL